MSTLVLPAYMKTFRGLADGSLSITFDTQELSPEEFSLLGKAQKKSGVLVFRPDKEKLSPEEIKEIDNIDVRIADETHKSPSQRLRSTMFVAFKEASEGYDTFEAYYIAKMDKVINHFKSKIDNAKADAGKSKSQKD